MKINRHNKIKSDTAITHRDSLRRNLENRLEIARSQGDETLIKQLEKEANYLHLQ
jgi:hypothetical protein